MSSNQIFTRILLLGLFFGPLTWLLASDEGQRVSDVFLLKLSGSPGVEMDVRQLAPAINEAELKSRFPKVNFQCADKQTDFGERLCYTPLAAFNGAPSQYMSAFFRGDHLMAVKIAYQRSYHDYIYENLSRELGAANRDRMAGLPDNSGAQQWQVGRGWLVLPGVGLKEDAEPALFWLAAP
jgi:hypothetical protein